MKLPKARSRQGDAPFSLLELVQKPTRKIGRRLRGAQRRRRVAANVGPYNLVLAPQQPFGSFPPLETLPTEERNAPATRESRARWISPVINLPAPFAKTRLGGTSSSVTALVPRRIRSRAARCENRSVPRPNLTTRTPLSISMGHPKWPKILWLSTSTFGKHASL